MRCPACGAESTRYKARYKNGVVLESCDHCSGGFRGTPDVYFKEAYLDEHIATEEFPGAKLITSRREKADWLKKCNLREAGDPVHGMTRFDPISHRHAMESLRRTK